LAPTAVLHQCPPNLHLARLPGGRSFVSLPSKPQLISSVPRAAWDVPFFWSPQKWMDLGACMGACPEKFWVSRCSNPFLWILWGSQKTFKDPKHYKNRQRANCLQPCSFHSYCGVGSFKFRYHLIMSNSSPWRIPYKWRFLAG
jgi:hypothetical protein